MSKPARPQRLMVIETFAPADAPRVYSRLRERGRLMPGSVRYVDSWVASTLDRCFQLVECSDEAGLADWIDAWKDLVDVEIVAVMTSAEASELSGSSAARSAANDTGPQESMRQNSREENAE